MKHLIIDVSSDICSDSICIADIDLTQEEEPDPLRLVPIQNSSEMIGDEHLLLALQKVQADMSPEFLIINPSLYKYIKEGRSDSGILRILFHSVGNSSGRIIIVPCCFDSHWWCYIVNLDSRRVIVKDSLEKESAYYRRHQDPVGIILNLLGHEYNLQSFTCDYTVEAHQQSPGTMDCGVFLYLEIINLVIKNSKSSFYFSEPSEARKLIAQRVQEMHLEQKEEQRSRSDREKFRESWQQAIKNKR
eukprot:TRINITY_DN1910_c0_g1_i2.p1 TRINITY_DN1910_c0_g1~~TRINITY_DN1910_c0_g1_i2.p1  ORF type:complete len:246 (+),score=39.21 TRINITY_DN1910_c0_g1_i2:628-1365(+)